MKEAYTGFTLETLDNLILMDTLRLLIGKKILSNLNMESIYLLERCCGLVTAALKLKREQQKAKFKDELQKLY